MSHWVSLKTNDLYLSMDTLNSLMPGGVFSKLPLDSSESDFIGYSIIAKAQKGDLNESLELFESNSQKLNPRISYLVYSSMVKEYLKNDKVDNALSFYCRAQESDFVSSSLLESLLENSEKLDQSLLEVIGQVGIESGCVPCPKDEPLLFKRLVGMNAYGK
jgi:pentatricopeptide repeat protein